MLKFSSVLKHNFSKCAVLFFWVLFCYFIIYKCPDQQLWKKMEGKFSLELQEWLLSLDFIFFFLSLDFNTCWPYDLMCDFVTLSVNPPSVKRRTKNNFFTVLLWGLTEKLVWSHSFKYKGSKPKEECVLYNSIYMNLRKAKQKKSDKNQNSDYDGLGYWLERNIQEHSRWTKYSIHVCW